MKILLSPAKSLDLKSPISTTISSIPVFLKQANTINEVLRVKSPEDLKKLMHISDDLANLNWKRNQEWYSTKEMRQAVYTFKGTAYIGLDAYSIDNDKQEYLQETLRILSGQYGILKPMDLIKAYRLEMGIKLQIDNYKNLYEFWGNKVTEALNTELKPDEVVVNLASNEYFKVIKSDLLKTQIITPVFKDYKNGQYKVISFYAKKARGMMTRFAIDNEIDNAEDLKTFALDAYAYDAKLSNENEWVFTR